MLDDSSEEQQPVSSSATEEKPTRSSGPRVRAIIAAVLAVLCLVVFFQNLEPVTVQLFFWSVQMATILLMLLLAFIGFVLGWILATLGKDRKKKN